MINEEVSTILSQLEDELRDRLAQIEIELAQKSEELEEANASLVEAKENSKWEEEHVKQLEVQLYKVALEAEVAKLRELNDLWRKFEECLRSHHEMDVCCFSE